MIDDLSLHSWILILVVLLGLTLLLLAVYAGLFTGIQVAAGPPPFGQICIAYKFARGPYKNAGHLFTEAHSLCPNLSTIGVYYDDPERVSPSDLRYVVGVVLSKGEEAQPKEEDVQRMTKNGFKLFTFPAATYAVQTRFPWNCTLSIFIAVARVYPKLAAYIQEHGLCAHPMMEVYEEKDILFLAPLSRQDEFYVPEVQDEEESVLTSRSDESSQLQDETASTLHGTDTESLSGSTRADPPEKPHLLDSLLPHKPSVLHEEEEEDLATVPEASGNGDESNGSSFEELDAVDADDGPAAGDARSRKRTVQS